MTTELYSLSDSLRLAISEAVDGVYACLTNKVRFIEYITLPDYGQRVILRFEPLAGVVTSLSQADALETQVRCLVSADFWANLHVEWRALCNDSAEHMSGGNMCELLESIDKTFPGSMLDFPATRHSERVREDARTLRAVLHLSPDDSVWEIEVPVEGPDLRPNIRVVMGNEHGSGPSSERADDEVVLGDTRCLVQYLKNNRSFWGATKAYLVAREKGMATVHFVFRSPRERDGTVAEQDDAVE